MQKTAVILIATSNDSDFNCVQEGLRSVGLQNSIERFVDTDGLSAFLFSDEDGIVSQIDSSYLLFMEDQLPGKGGEQLLRNIKEKDLVKKLPVIIVSSKEDKEKVDKFHYLGCSIYLTKPEDNEKFKDIIRQIGLFLSIVELPQISNVH